MLYEEKAHFFSKTVKKGKNEKKGKYVIKKHLFYDENDLLMILKLKYPISHGKRMIPWNFQENRFINGFKFKKNGLNYICCIEDFLS